MSKSGSYIEEFAKLEQKVEMISDKLDDIVKNLQELTNSINASTLNNALTKKDVDILGEKYRDLTTNLELYKKNTDNTIKEIRAKIQSLAIKITSVCSIAVILFEIGLKVIFK